LKGKNLPFTSHHKPFFFFASKKSRLKDLNQKWCNKINKKSYLFKVIFNYDVTNKGRICRPLLFLLSFDRKENSDFPNDNNKFYYHYLSFQSLQTVGKRENSTHVYKVIDFLLNIGYLNCMKAS